MQKLLYGLLVAGIWALNVSPALAQYPVKQIRLVVPFPPGGGSDIVGRALAEKLSARVGQLVFVDNKPGAAGSIGSEAVARSTPDGYTVWLSSIGGPAIGLSYYRRFGFDIRRDFAPISRIGQGTIVLVVPPSLNVSSIKELIALAKAKPGKLDFASGGTGTQTHLSVELFKIVTGVDIVHVPYKGIAQYLPDLMSGRIALSVDNLAPLLPHIQAGRLRALAVASTQRSLLLPDVPTMAEAGVLGFESSLEYALLAPVGTSVEIIEILNREINIVLQHPDLRDKLIELGIEPSGSSPEGLRALIEDEVAKWASVIKTANIAQE